MHRALVSTTLAVIAATATARAQAPAGAAPAAELERARAAAAALTAELQGRLMKELAAGGPATAVRVCSEVAPAIAKEDSKDGLVVRRVSERWRNPADAPDAWESGQLQRLAVAHARGELPAEVVEVVSSGSWRVVRYLKPIVIGARCLACHGDPAAIEPAVAVLIRERYPRTARSATARGSCAAPCRWSSGCGSGAGRRSAGLRRAQELLADHLDGVRGEIGRRRVVALLEVDAGVDAGRGRRAGGRLRLAVERGGTFQNSASSPGNVAPGREAPAGWRLTA
jgi:hypothetical protein